MNLKARRGAVIVMLGIMIVTLVGISAISIDFSRLWSLRNELQTSADAAAHAGAVQLSPPNNAWLTDSVARAFASANLAMAGSVTVDSVELGDWDDIGKTFTPAAPHTDAVRVVVSRQSSGLIMSILGVLPPRLKARAITGKAYLEMWVRVPGRGEFFSRGLEHPVTGTSDWVSLEIPFFLSERGLKPDLVKLNVAFEGGGGTVWIKDVQLLHTPLDG